MLLFLSLDIVPVLSLLFLFVYFRICKSTFPTNFISSADRLLIVPIMPRNNLGFNFRVSVSICNFIFKMKISLAWPFARQRAKSQLAYFSIHAKIRFTWCYTGRERLIRTRLIRSST